MSAKVCRILIHTYMLMSVLVLVLLIPLRDAMPALYTMGANSWLISIALASGGTLVAPIGVMLVLWGCAFPILLILFYILACKGKFIPFCTLACADSLIVICWLIYCLYENNKYALQWAVPDAIVSTLFSVALVASLWWSSRTEDGTVC